MLQNFEGLELLSVLWCYLHSIGSVFMNLACSSATQEELDQMCELNAVLPSDRQWMVDPDAWWFRSGSQPIPLQKEHVIFQIPRFSYATLAISSDTLVRPKVHEHIFLRPTNHESVRWSSRMSPREHYFTVSQTRVKIYSVEFSLESSVYEGILKDDWLLSWTPLSPDGTDYDSILSEKLNWHSVMRRSDCRVVGRNACRLQLRWDVPSPVWTPYGQEIEVNRLLGIPPPAGDSAGITPKGQYYQTKTDWKIERTGFGSEVFGFIRIMRRKTRDVHTMHAPEAVDMRTSDHGDNTARLSFTVDYELNRPNTERYDRGIPCLNSETSRVRVVKARICEQDPDSDNPSKYGAWNAGYVAYQTKPPAIFP
jgi:hypothetical protein